MVSNARLHHGQVASFPLLSSSTLDISCMEGDYYVDSSGSPPIAHQEDMDRVSMGVGYEDVFLKRASSPTH